MRGEWFYLLIVSVLSFFMTRPYLYAIQQDNYRLIELVKSKRIKQILALDLLCAVIFYGAWGVIYYLQYGVIWLFLIALFYYLVEFILYAIEELNEKKKPFRYTNRVIRSIILLELASLVIMGLCLFLVNRFEVDYTIKYLLVMSYLFLMPTIFAIVISIQNVFEKMNNIRYERNTKKILDNCKDTIKIAITGSYGKTTVKNILKDILSTQYNVLATPLSYNTPMGISKTVKYLDLSYDIFIAEMGARRIKDIENLMKIVNPDYSLLTGINKQHLETFKSEKNIFLEKTKIITMLGEEGKSFVQDKLEDRINGEFEKDNLQILYVGNNPTSKVCISNVAVSTQGSEFTLKIGSRCLQLNTPLLGMHNIENIALAVAMAVELDITFDNIEKAVSMLESTPHRMQLIEGVGINIIDDTFNSNPDGARLTLDVLSMFDGRKIVLTPGLVELGESEKEENYALGKYIASVADVIILIGATRSLPIKKGINDAEFLGEIYVFDTLSDAEKEFNTLLHMGDNLLLLNDLPDIYND